MRRRARRKTRTIEHAPATSRLSRSNTHALAFTFGPIAPSVDLSHNKPLHDAHAQLRCRSKGMNGQQEQRPLDPVVAAGMFGHYY